MNELDAIVENARKGFEQAATPAELENAKAQFLGKAGRITDLHPAPAAVEELRRSLNP